MRVQQLFAEVVGLDDERRSARLERVEDSGIRREVQTLLDRHARGEPLSENALSPRAREAEEGEVVGRYRLLDELGRGAMGVVYRAEDTRLGRPVALKFLSPELSADKRARARLEREARAASALDHPNICTVYEIGETDDGRLYLALACYDGETLARRIERGPLEIEEAVRTAVHVARGLAAAHRHGIVHRDVKPSNVLVTDDRVVKLLDFGIARVADSDLTGSDDVLGTVAYMSPEQLRGEVDARVDVWALGVVLYEMLTGARPFRGDYEAALLYAVLHEDPAPLDRDDVPEELAEIVRRCLEKDPADRFQSTEEVEVALERLGLGSASVPPMRRAVRRRRSLVLGAALLAVVLLVSPVRMTVAGWLGLGGGTDVQHLAVLPLLASAEEASVGEGLTLTLTSLLTRLGAHSERPVAVVPASEMREIMTAAEVRERFDVDVIVSGDFRQEGERAYLTLNIIDARTLRQIDSVPLTEPTSRLPYLQQRALAELAEMLGLSFSADQEAAFFAGGTMDSQAYAMYLKGESELEGFDQRERVEASIQFFTWALASDSLFALAHAGLGEAYVRMYQFTRDPEWVSLAEQHSYRALEIADRLVRAYVTLGLLRNSTGDYDEALRVVSIALALDSTNATAHHWRAIALRELQRVDEAEQSFKRSITLDPQNWKRYNDLGAFYLRVGSLDSAVVQLERGIALAPDQPHGYENLGIALLLQERYDEAQRTLERAIDLRPSYRAYTSLGTIYTERDRYDDAVMAYERALAINDADYVVWGLLADAMEQAGRAVEADEAYRRALGLVDQQLQVAAEDPTLLADRAAYLLALGAREEAASVLRSVPMNTSSDAYLAYRVASLYMALGDEARARQWVREAIDRGLPPSMLADDPELERLL